MLLVADNQEKMLKCYSFQFDDLDDMIGCPWLEDLYSVEYKRDLERAQSLILDP